MLRRRPSGRSSRATVSTVGLSSPRSMRLMSAWLIPDAVASRLRSSVATSARLPVTGVNPQFLGGGCRYTLRRRDGTEKPERVVRVARRKSEGTAETAASPAGYRRVDRLSLRLGLVAFTVVAATAAVLLWQSNHELASAYRQQGRAQAQAVARRGSGGAGRRRRHGSSPGLLQRAARSSKSAARGR